MTKEEWSKVEKALSGLYGSTKLLVDGHKITFRRVLVDKHRLGIVTYVDGEIRGEWYNADKPCPEQRFLRKATRFVHKPAVRAKLKKLWPKSRKPAGEYWNPDAKFHYFLPWWTDATALRRHYQKTFQSIELVEVVGC